MIPAKAIIPAKVMHKRLLPQVNQFLYKVFYIFFDISKLNQLQNLFFSIDKFNLFSFYQKDHGYKSSSKDLDSFIRGILKKEKVKCDGKVYLMTYPRILGYVFNPVSFWYCTDQEDNLVAVLAQVNNTFKEHHNYLIYEKNNKPLDQEKFYEANKEFHVSPFMKVEGEYRFRFVFDGKKIAAHINLYDEKQRMMLATCVKGDISEFSIVNLIKSFIAIPLMTFKVIILIHYQALKLILKRIKYIRKPDKTKKLVTKTRN